MRIPFKYIFTKARQWWTLDRLERVVFALTYRCNLACRTCGAWPKSKQAHYEELGVGSVLSVIDQLPSLNIQDVVLVGSEVLLYEGILDVCRSLNQNRLRWSLMTNASLVDSSLAEALLDCNPHRLTVSIDGPQELHDLLRGNKSFALAMRGLELFETARRRKNGSRTRIGIHMTLSRYNCSSIEPVSNLCWQRGWDFSVQVASHASREQITNSLLSGEQAASIRFLPRAPYGLRPEDALHIREAHAALAAEDVFIPSLHLAASLTTAALTSGQFPVGRCRTIRKELLIEPDGRVVICANLDAYELGNVRTTSLQEIWRSERRRTVCSSVGRGGPPICSACCNYPENLSLGAYMRAGVAFMRTVTFSRKKDFKNQTGIASR